MKWLRAHRLAVGVGILALSGTYVAAALVAEHAAEVVAVGYTVVVVVATFLTNLASHLGRRG